MATTVEEIAHELVDLKEREKNENNLDMKNYLNQRIIESTKTLNLLLAQQGTFLFPDLSRRLCVSFFSRSRSMKGRPSCFLFFIDFVSFHLFAFTVLFSSFSIVLFYTLITSPIWIPSELLFVPAAATGRKTVDDVPWLIDFASLLHAETRLCVCYVSCLTFLSFFFLSFVFHFSWRSSAPNHISNSDAIRNSTSR